MRRLSAVAAMSLAGLGASGCGGGAGGGPTLSQYGPSVLETIEVSEPRPGMIVVEARQSDLFDSAHVWCAAARRAATNGAPEINLLSGSVMERSSSAPRFAGVYRFHAPYDDASALPGEADTVRGGPEPVQARLTECDKAGMQREDGSA